MALRPSQRPALFIVVRKSGGKSQKEKWQKEQGNIERRELLGNSPFFPGGIYRARLLACLLLGHIRKSSSETSSVCGNGFFLHPNCYNLYG